MKTPVRVVLGFLGVVAAWRSFAAEPAGLELRFGRDIRPILSDKCFPCHGPDSKTRKAGLRLDTFAAATADRGGYAAVIPRDPARSELIARINAEDPEEAMPPPSHRKRLSAREKGALERWIGQGAEFEEHWAFRRPVRAALPEVRADAWPRGAIDRFVLARLEALGMEPAPEADRATLLRRVTLDLTGLPPTPAAVAAFVQDGRADAYEAAVDRLLASPEFGVRWARPWLDLARYADSHGFQRDDLREVWAYRDWVVRALNDDMPFDQFTIAQLAGDLLPGSTRADQVATGFHRCSTTNVEAGSEPEETRINQVIDRVDTTGTVWLGLTFECARCHDHKFDPIAQKEYFRLLAFFNNTESEVERANPKVPSSIRFRGPSLALDGSSGQAEPKRRGDEAGRLQAEAARLDRAIAAATRRAVKDLPAWEARLRQDAGSNPAAGAPGPVPSQGIAAILAVPAARRDARQRRELREFFLTQVPEVARLKRTRAAVARQLAASKPPSTLVMRELATPRTTAVFKRGLYTDPGEVVTAGVPAIFPPLSAGRLDRLALARWLVSADNPLTARVAVNRWWAEIFGRGIVPTVENFGVQGDLPSHPELLDWLALELVERGWSMKRVLRLIVTSATYRQASRAPAEARQRDPENRWLARGPRFRMDAEMIRDNALFVAGLLSFKQGGPPIRPPQPDGLWTKVGGERYDYEVSPGTDRDRRGLYVVLKRSAPYPSLVNFDAPPRLTCVARRARSNTPLQALTLLNDPVFVEAAMALGARVVAETTGADLDTRLGYAFRLGLCRPPRPAEIASLRNLYQDQFAAASADAASARTLARTYRRPTRMTDAEFAAWYAVASALMNLDAFITKD